MRGSFRNLTHPAFESVNKDESRVLMRRSSQHFEDESRRVFWRRLQVVGAKEDARTQTAAGSEASRRQKRHNIKMAEPRGA